MKMMILTWTLMILSGPGQSGILTPALYSVLSFWMLAPPLPMTLPAILLGTRTLASTLPTPRLLLPPSMPPVSKSASRFMLAITW